MKNRFVEKLTKNIKKPYYYVPPCPNCGANATGRYLKSTSNYNNDWILKESLKNGEIVSFLPEVDDEYQCFCLECDEPFNAEPKLMMLSKERIENQKILRGTKEMYALLDEERRKEEKETLNKRGPLMNTIIKSIGHL